MRTRLAALLVKELTLHARGVVLVLLGLVSLQTALLYFGSYFIRSPTADREYAVLLYMNFLALPLWMEWFVAREKTTQTFAWLRSLPIGAGELYGSKIAAVSLCIVSLWTLSVVIAVGDRHGGMPWTMGVALQAALLVFGAVAVFARWRFSQKLGQACVVLFALLLISVFGLLHFSGALTVNEMFRIWDTRPGRLGVIAALVALYGGVGWMGYRWVAASETRALVE